MVSTLCCFLLLLKHADMYLVHLWASHMKVRLEAVVVINGNWSQIRVSQYGFQSECSVKKAKVVMVQHWTQENMILSSPVSKISRFFCCQSFVSFHFHQLFIHPLIRLGNPHTWLSFIKKHVGVGPLHQIMFWKYGFNTDFFCNLSWYLFVKLSLHLSEGKTHFGF